MSGVSIDIKTGEVTQFVATPVLCTQADLIVEIEQAIDTFIAQTAQAKGYNSTESCLSYIGDPNVQWNNEAVAFRDWRSACWQYVIQEQAKIVAGTRTMPTPEQAILELPLIVWP